MARIVTNVYVVSKPSVCAYLPLTSTFSVDRQYRDRHQNCTSTTLQAVKASRPQGSENGLRSFRRGEANVRACPLISGLHNLNLPS